MISKPVENSEELLGDSLANFLGDANPPMFRKKLAISSSPGKSIPQRPFGIAL